ncbi:MAG: sel1 repeat family protein, partial [Synergistaceae bacterium]|nr:sel1 repeat family protein [Synergistaceae bacterium]
EEKISGILFAQMEKGALDSDEAQEVIHSMRLSELVTSMKIADTDSAVAMALYFEGNNDALERMSKSSGNPIVFHALRLIEQLKGSAGNYARVIEYVKKHDSLRDKIDEAYSEIAPLVKNYADEGRENAKIFMADMLMYGWGIEQDTKKAEEIFTELAENGNVYAQFVMVQSHFAPVSKKQQTASKVQQTLSPEQIEALFQTGENFFYGIRGYNKDRKKAVEYYSQAANAGHANAQYTLGHMYRFGYGVNKDLQKARYWYQQAADQGNATARVQLEDMNKNRE